MADPMASSSTYDPDAQTRKHLNSCLAATVVTTAVALSGGALAAPVAGFWVLASLLCDTEDLSAQTNNEATPVHSDSPLDGASPPTAPEKEFFMDVTDFLETIPEVPDEEPEMPPDRPVRVYEEEPEKLGDVPEIPGYWELNAEPSSSSADETPADLRVSTQETEAPQMATKEVKVAAGSARDRGGEGGLRGFFRREMALLRAQFRGGGQ
uniref:Uncharacterized protein n=1 Tax=Chromera velia CCMP2878 TaxID=1169474 RepID=A0A0G4H8K6_9ALVE|eukprot:Cvel_5871.t1-p1 / transcript=Cvel_5871.t1 / gene=Cvel_5871 / organism=Chromera_velia_CCMP2878 / gene_product=hypothetical protein / transcript_product=hypothetical protein / location=Cvel_scaffold279:59746-63281(+) / protein_length=209 / sequence_SO=supercontig / SO=protein_coding / is_pseudo=false